MSKRFENKVILVTGATAGMGRAAAERLGAEGATVVLAARNKDRGEEIAGRIQDKGGKALFVPTDVTVEEDVAAVVEAATSTFGRLDGAFNNAGGGVTFGAVHSMEASFWDSTLALNLTSMFYSMKYEVPAILASGGGSIVNNASVGGAVGHESMHAYSAAKHGVIGLTRSTALHYARQNLRVNALVTGVISTPLTEELRQRDPAFSEALLKKIPIERLGQEDEVGAFAAFLLTDEAAYINGAALAIDGGITAGMLA